MSCRYGIVSLFLFRGILVFVSVFGIQSSFAQAQTSPLVIGYERFHSEKPSLEGGRLLFNELGCVNCHNHPTGLPERKGPRLEGLASRVQHEWIEAFLKNPSATKPGSNMPQMHLSDEEIEAATHYLASLKLKKKKLPKTKEKKTLSRRLLPPASLPSSSRMRYFFNFFNFISDFEDEQRQQKRGTVADRRA